MAKRKSYAVPMDDAQWRAEADARTLIEACKIEKDPKRMAAAKKAAKKMVDEAQEALVAAQNVHDGYDD